MKRALVLLSVFALVLSVVPSAHAETAVSASTLVINGLAADSAPQVEAALKALPGVTAVKVNEAAGLAVVVYDPALVQQEQLTQAVQSAGYLATFAAANFRCPSCPATYAEAGTCIVDGSTLEANS